MAAKQQKIKIKIDEDLKPKERIALADLIIEHIAERTNKGYTINDAGRRKKFPKYSKEYIESKDFEIAGKSKNKVNLQLSGDMLAELSLLSHSRGSITIGYERGSEENARAEGNILGTYGQKTPDAKKARDFLKVHDKEVDGLTSTLAMEGVKPIQLLAPLSKSAKTKELEKLQKQGIVDGRLNLQKKTSLELDEILVDVLDEL